ncbi:hypothetical protein DSM104329_04124 [Capillimicrobium parvum]|uniref:DUF1152 domain-containing protein n=1 Tax=Capillimicrobium parvum TaxID=2884022 RepID=A0A9E6Y128_9ACTN|nr:hypothetical protein DSM104329_04124 [Capillimicrobium parvum]
MGALVVADLAERFGASAVVGGLTWERRVVDPLPGPRRLDEITGAEPLNDAVALASPETSGPGGFRFAESHLAGVLGERTVLVDPHPGPAGVAAALDDACVQLGCDLVALVDVGGDVLAHGHEPGLGSPLADSLLLAAAAHLRTPTTGAVWGAACDGELTLEEVLERLAELAAGGALTGVWGTPPDLLDRLDAAVAAVPTEASAQAVACARGATGPAPIRDGRRTVPRSPVGALTFIFDPQRALEVAVPMAAALLDAASLEDAESILAARGIRTELAYERRAAS